MLGRYGGATVPNDNSDALGLTSYVIRPDQYGASDGSGSGALSVICWSCLMLPPTDYEPE
jgi:hypothetical protein